MDVYRKVTNLKVLGLLNRGASMVILCIVVSIAVWAAYSVYSGTQATQRVTNTYRWYSYYHNLADDFDEEYGALLLYNVAPIPAHRERIVKASQTFLNEPQPSVPDGSGLDDATIIASIATQYRAYMAAEDRITPLMARFADVPIENYFITRLQPLHYHLASLLDAEALGRFTRARIFDIANEEFTQRLRTLVMWSACLGLLVLGGLLYTTNVYKRRSDLALRDELRRLEEAALVDSLTSLGNHRAFYDEFEREVSRAQRHNMHLALALIDIDDFKSINDTRGHKYGDEILIRLGQVLSSFRTEDRAFRLGGDEFSIIFTQATQAEAKSAATRLQKMIRRSLANVTVSIGICGFGVGQDAQDLYERADAALYEAKRNGRNLISEFSDLRDAAKVFSSRKAAAVRTLLEQEALDIAFQPIWKLDGSGILGFEALARPHRKLGLSGPQEAFDIAERIRKVPELDALCLRKAFEAAAGLSKTALLFLNVTPETLSRPDFNAARWVKLVTEAGLSPKQIIVGITERSIGNPTELIHHAKELQKAGLRIALDDAGAGYAGLEILSKLPADFVKIDRSVVVRAITEEGARAVFAGIVAFARQANSYIIAEGIEELEQLDMLRQFPELPSEPYAGIRGVQGFLLGKPRTGAPAIETFQSFGQILQPRNNETTRKDVVLRA